ncbi:MAG: MFS transporter [Oligoflexales bacterium]|nr:MFS transporter [Oligoflexales bacterium]
MFLDMSPLLKNSKFRLLFLAQLISSFGSQMTIITIPFQIYQLTNSILLTGLVGAVELVTLVLTALYGGVLSDHYDRKKIIMISELFMTLCVVFLAFNAMREEPNLYCIFVGAGLISGFNGLHRPAMEALLPAIVSRDQLEAVSSLSPLRTIVSAILGPSLAGLLIARFGPAWALFIDASTFAVSLLLISCVSQPPKVKTEAKVALSFWTDIKGGVSYLIRRRDILGTYLIDFSAMVCASPQVLMPHIAQQFAADSSLGLLYASSSAGAFFAAIFSRWTSQVDRHGQAIAWAAVAWATCIACIAWAPGIYTIMILLFFAGAFDMISGIFRMTIWNKTIPPSVRGRMASFEMLSYASGPLLGQLFIGSLASLFGYKQALFLGAVLAVLLIAVACFFLREFIKYRDSKFVPLEE